MNKGTKVNYLYKIAMGQPVNLSPADRKELSKYKVERIGKPLTTKANISQYVSAVDKGCHKGFYDWCLDNHKGDRRAKDGKAGSIKASNMSEYMCIIFFGWITWGVAIYWMLGESLSVGGCAILGAIVTVIVYKLKRDWVFFTCFFLPIIIAILCYEMRM